MSPQISPASRYWLMMGAMVAVGCLLRFGFSIDYAEEVDSIRFLLALDDFNVAAHRPHFPGYPVFVILGKLVYWIFGDPVLALSILCALCGGLLPVPVGSIVRSALGDRAGLWAGLLVVLNPLLWLYSTKLLSDMPGLFFLATSLALLAKSWQTGSDRLAWAGFFILGLTMGVRLSYFPFVFSAIAVSWFVHKRLASPVLFLFLGGLAWALPFVLASGVEPLANIGAVQTTGHFTRWGGSIWTQSDVVERVTTLFWQLSAQGLGAWWPDRSWWYLIPTAGLIGFLLIRLSGSNGPRLPWAFWLIWTLPYLLWIFLAQNITVKTRHCLPLVVLGTFFVAAELASLIKWKNLGAERVRWALPVAAICAVVWLAGLVTTGFLVAWEHKAVPSNAVLLSKEVEQLCQQQKKTNSAFVVYTASMQRHLERHAPCAEVVRIRRLSHARREVSGRAPDVVAYVVSDVPRVSRLRKPPVRRWKRSRYVQNARTDTSLYLLRGEMHD